MSTGNDNGNGSDELDPGNTVMTSMAEIAKSQGDVRSGDIQTDDAPSYEPKPEEDTVKIDFKDDTVQGEVLITEDSGEVVGKSVEPTKPSFPEESRIAVPQVGTLEELPPPLPEDALKGEGPIGKSSMFDFIEGKTSSADKSEVTSQGTETAESEPQLELAVQETAEIEPEVVPETLAEEKVDPEAIDEALVEEEKPEEKPGLIGRIWKRAYGDVRDTISSKPVEDSPDQDTVEEAPVVEEPVDYHRREIGRDQLDVVLAEQSQGSRSLKEPALFDDLKDLEEALVSFVGSSEFKSIKDLPDNDWTPYEKLRFVLKAYNLGLKSELKAGKEAARLKGKNETLGLRLVELGDENEQLTETNLELKEFNDQYTAAEEDVRGRLTDAETAKLRAEGDLKLLKDEKGRVDKQLEGYEAQIEKYTAVFGEETPEAVQERVTGLEEKIEEDRVDGQAAQGRFGQLDARFKKYVKETKAAQEEAAAELTAEKEAYTELKNKYDNNEEELEQMTTERDRVLVKEKEANEKCSGLSDKLVDYELAAVVDSPEELGDKLSHLHDEKQQAVEERDAAQEKVRAYELVAKVDSSEKLKDKLDCLETGNVEAETAAQQKADRGYSLEKARRRRAEKETKGYKAVLGEQTPEEIQNQMDDLRETVSDLETEKENARVDHRVEVEGLTERAENADKLYEQKDSELEAKDKELKILKTFLDDDPDDVVAKYSKVDELEAELETERERYSETKVREISLEVSERKLGLEAEELKNKLREKIQEVGTLEACVDDSGKNLKKANRRTRFAAVTTGLTAFIATSGAALLLGYFSEVSEDKKPSQKPAIVYRQDPKVADLKERIKKLEGVEQKYSGLQKQHRGLKNAYTGLRAQLAKKPAEKSEAKKPETPEQPQPATKGYADWTPADWGKGLNAALGNDKAMCELKNAYVKAHGKEKVRDMKKFVGQMVGPDNTGLINKVAGQYNRMWSLPDEIPTGKYVLMENTSCSKFKK